MKPAAPLFWHQGLFLQPHHFQQMERSLWTSILPRFAMLQPFFWGVRALEIRESSLADQVLELVQGEFLFPDGTYCCLPDNAHLAARSFKKTWTETERPLKAYVGIPRWRETRNVTVTGPEEDPGELDARFTCATDPKDIKDLHEEGPAAPVRVLTHAMKLFWEAEVPDLHDHVLIPVALVENTRGTLRLSPAFAPPALQVADSKALAQLLREIRDQASSFCRNLEEYKGAQEEEGRGGIGTYLAALRVLGRYIPLFQHLANAGGIHPWELFGLLRQFTGELSTFSSRVNVLGHLPDGRSLVRDYDHNDALPAFTDLQTLIGELLGAILVGPQRIIDLVRAGDRFQGLLPLDALDNGNELFLTVRTSDPHKNALAEQVGRIAKLSTPDRVATLAARSLSGVTLEGRLVPPPGLPRHPDALYFWIDQQHPQWQEVRRSQSLCLLWGEAPEDAKAEIVVLRK